MRTSTQVRTPGYPTMTPAQWLEHWLSLAPRLSDQSMDAIIATLEEEQEEDD